MEYNVGFIDCFSTWVRGDFNMGSGFGGGGYTTLINNVVPTSQRPWYDIAANQVFSNPISPYYNVGTAGQTIYYFLSKLIQNNNSPPGNN